MKKEKCPKGYSKLDPRPVVLWFAGIAAFIAIMFFLEMIFASNNEEGKVSSIKDVSTFLQVVDVRLVTLYDDSYVYIFGSELEEDSSVSVRVGRMTRMAYLGAGHMGLFVSLEFYVLLSLSIGSFLFRFWRKDIILSSISFLACAEIYVLFFEIFWEAVFLAL